MKRLIMNTPSLLLFTFSLLFAPLMCLNAATIFIRTSAGPWSNMSYWKDYTSGQALPATDFPRENDKVILSSEHILSMDMDTQISELLLVNGSHDATLILDRPFSLSVNVTRVGQVGREGQGLLKITKGALDMTGRLFVTSTSRVVIDGGILGSIFDGDARSFQGDGVIELKSGRLSMLGTQQGDTVIFDNAVTVVSGGAFESSQTIFGWQNEAELRIVGDVALVRLKSLNQEPGYAPHGRFHFVFNEAGVSTIEVETFMRLSGAELMIDGSSYKGESGSFRLFTASNFVSAFDVSNITVKGLGREGIDWEIIQNKVNGNVLLKIIRNSMGE